MKSISDTTFGLECKAKEKEFTRRIDYLDWYERVRNNFSNFLKQPLTLGMFVPCDENGNVLEEPLLLPSYELDKYRKAKEKVIFDGFDIIHNDKVRITIECNHFQLDFNKPLNHFENYKTIEDLPINLDCVVSF